MQIENIELLELFMETVCEAVETQSSAGGGVASSTLTRQLAGNACLMLSIADRYEALSEPSLALLTRKIELALQDDMLLETHRNETPSRLLDYVYPVV